MKSPSAEQIRNTLLAVCITVSAGILGYLQREPRASEILSEEDLANEIDTNQDLSVLPLADFVNLPPNTTSFCIEG